MSWPLTLILLLAIWLLLAAALIATTRPRTENDAAKLADWGIGGPG